MYLVRDPHRETADHTTYVDVEQREFAYARASEVRICGRCGRDLGANVDGRQAVLEYPSADATSEDSYLLVVCWDCVPGAIEAVQSQDDLRSGDHFAYPSPTHPRRAGADEACPTCRAPADAPCVYKSRPVDVLEDHGYPLISVGDRLEEAALDAENRHPQGYR